tara:strand:+ start:101 stop:337 length:237 start_codon:yes stop_codon:yes gene_type:complete
MTRLDRWVIRRCIKGDFSFIAPRFAHCFDLKFVRPVTTERWSLCTGRDGESISLGRLAHLCLRIAQKNQTRTRKEKKE